MGSVSRVGLVAGPGGPRAGPGGPGGGPGGPGNVPFGPGNVPFGSGTVPGGFGIHPGRVWDPSRAAITLPSPNWIDTGKTLDRQWTYTGPNWTFLGHARACH